MRWALELVEGPAIEPVLLAELKRHLGGFDDVTDFDDDITAAGVTAREQIEQWTGRALVDQTWRINVGGESVLYDSVAFAGASTRVSERNGTEILLRRSPVLEVLSFVSVDSEGAETAVDASSWELMDAASKYPRIVARNGACWLSGLYRITFRAGFADLQLSPADDGTAVPERFRMALKMWAEAFYYRDAQAMDKLIEAARGLVRNDKTDMGFA